MTNVGLLELDPRYLVGTGTVKEFPSEVVDTYLKASVRETIDYETFSEAMWNHVVQRFGSDKEIKRFYTKGQMMYSTSVETRFKDVMCLLARADEVKDGKHPGYV